MMTQKQVFQEKHKGRRKILVGHPHRPRFSSDKPAHRERGWWSQPYLFTPQSEYSPLAFKRSARGRLKPLRWLMSFISHYGGNNIRNNPVPNEQS
jgi:hypothetical protein